MAAPKVVNPKPTEAASHYLPPRQGAWTYEDYRRLLDNGMRYEVIEGNLYMSPAPRPKHQKVIALLYGHLWDFLKQHPVGEVFFAPIDVILPDIAGPVQPDLLFISHDRRGVIQENVINGVPNLIAEVLSPGNPQHDRNLKFNAYAKAGVQEYWLIDPDGRTMEVYVLRGQAYALLGLFQAVDTAYSEVLPNFTVSVEDICPR